MILWVIWDQAWGIGDVVRGMRRFRVGSSCGDVGALFSLRAGRIGVLSSSYYVVGQNEEKSNRNRKKDAVS